MLVPQLSNLCPWVQVRLLHDMFVRGSVILEGYFMFSLLQCLGVIGKGQFHSAANSDWTSPGSAAQCWTSGKKMMTKTRPLTMIPQVWSEKEKGPFHLNSLSPGVVMHRPGWASPGSLPVTRNGNVARAIICRAVSEMPGKGGSVRTPLLPLDASFPTDNPQEHSLFWEGFFLSHWGPKANWNKS